jgi:hypothetical protein
MDIFASVRVASWYSITGGVRNFVDCLTFRLNTDRFQQSIAFEITVVLYLIVQAFVIARENSSVTSLKQFLSQPWMGLDIISYCMFIAVLVVDIVLNVFIHTVRVVSFGWRVDAFADVIIQPSWIWMCTLTATLHSGLLLICKILSEVEMRCDDNFTHP